MFSACDRICVAWRRIGIRTPRRMLNIERRIDKAPPGMVDGARAGVEQYWDWLNQDPNPDLANDPDLMEKTATMLENRCTALEELMDSVEQTMLEQT